MNSRSVFPSCLVRIYRFRTGELSSWSSSISTSISISISILIEPSILIMILIFISVRCEPFKLGWHCFGRRVEWCAAQVQVGFADVEPKGLGLRLGLGVSARIRELNTLQLGSGSSIKYVTKQLSSTNPYESPLADADLPLRGDSTLQEGERIHFAGRITRATLIRALAGRFSWPGLATLAVGALICFAASPPQFLNPFVRQGALRVDAMAEMLGLAGLGFLLLAIWHVGENCTAWGVRRRERYFLDQNPELYEEQLTGWLGKEEFYLHDSHCESWLSWVALNHVQSNDEVAFLEWGTGAGGITVLTRSLFNSDADFQRARVILNQSVTGQFDHRRLSQLADHHMPKTAGEIWPSDEETVAECEQNLTYGDGLRFFIWQMPMSVFAGSRPVHWLFGILAVGSTVFAEHQPFSLLTILAIWLTILLLAGSVTLFQARYFFLREHERLLVSRMRFTPAEIHVAATIGYFRMPLSRFLVRKCAEGEIVLMQKGHAAVETKLIPDQFADRGQWLALRTLLS